MTWKRTNDIAYAIVTEAVRTTRIAQDMIAEAEANARAEAEARILTQCRHCQAELVNFRIANPDAADTEMETALQKAWESCGVCSEEYNQHLDRQAEEWEARQFGNGYAEELNANPHLFCGGV